MIPFHPSYIFKAVPQLVSYLPVTFGIVVFTVIFGSALGFGLAKAKISKNKPACFLANTYITVIRCTPPIILLFIAFYGIPGLLKELFNIDVHTWNNAVFVVVSFSLLFAATMCEIMRTAYQAIDSGQYEAAISIGMTDIQAFTRIVLPQAIAVALPNFTNALVALMKDGSLAYTIGVVDMMGKGTLIIAKNYGSYALETYIALAILYWGLTLVIEQALGTVERKLTKGKQVIA